MKKIISLLIVYIANVMAINLLEMPENLMVFENDKAIDKIDKKLSEGNIKNKCNSNQGCYTKFDINIFSQKVDIVVPVSIRCIRTNECFYELNSVITVETDNVKQKTTIKSSNRMTSNFYEMTIWNDLKNNYNLMVMETVYHRSYKIDGIEIFIKNLKYKHLPNLLNFIELDEKVLEKKPIICLYPKDKKECLKSKFIIRENLVFKENQRIMPLQKNTVLYYNNTAYYLQKAGSNEEAIYLLEKIIEKFPDRTVAYYNLGDAYWELGDKEKAVKAYSTYIEQMKANGKEKKIPQVVKDRVSSK